MKNMKVKIITVVGIIYVLLSIVVTKFLLDRNDYGAFETGSNYYICNKEIKEFGSTNLVQFEKSDDYSSLINNKVYYFDESKNLKNDVLVGYDKEGKVFTIGEEKHNIEQLLGVPKKGYFLLGIIINFLTTKVFYLIFIIVPVAFLFVYEIYLLVDYIRGNKNRKQK